MCGLLGEFSFQHSILSKTEEFSSLLELSKHRGPDSTEIIREDNYQLGFNRLAILDLSAKGNQPKHSPSKRYVVVFNGEIYNYKELQKEFQLTNLQSTSDTEVLTHLLDKCGVEETVYMLNGMYSIAIVDKLNDTVSLVRDFAGIKPLFYGISNNGIVFASQFDQIFNHSWHHSSLKLRPEIMKEYFGFGFMHAPNTIYENIFQIGLGELLQFSRQGKMIKKSYLKFSKYAPKKNKKQEKKYREVLKKVVSRQLISDVPLASFLSGGVDSPLVTAVAKEIKKNIEAFTFGIDNSKHDESKKAIEYAKYLKIDHSLEHVVENEIVSIVEEHFNSFSEPFGDYSSVPTYLITKKARKSHTVMLSGDGGDELFFGYPRMLDVLNKRRWFSIPFIIRKPLIRLLNKIKIINTWAPYSYRTLEHWIKAKQLHIKPEVLDSLFGKTSFTDEIKNLFRISSKTKKEQLIHWLRWNEFYGHLQRVLIKVDRTSMGNSLEVRVPFLDKESIRYAWNNTPLELKNHLQLKHVLKDSLSFYIPSELIEQDKKGFSVPIEEWLRNELKEDLKKYIFKVPFYGEDLINTSKLKEYVSDFLEYKHNNGWGIWHIYAWQKWAYRHLSIS